MDPSFFDSRAKEKKAKTTISIGRFLGFDNEVIRKIIKAWKIRKPWDIRKLARLNKAQWVKEVAKTNTKLKDKKIDRQLCFNHCQKV